VEGEIEKKNGGEVTKKPNKERGGGNAYGLDQDGLARRGEKVGVGIHWKNAIVGVTDGDWFNNISRP